jgi:hypothetical protein
MREVMYRLITRTKFCLMFVFGALTCRTLRVIGNPAGRSDFPVGRKGRLSLQRRDQVIEPSNILDRLQQGAKTSGEITEDLSHVIKRTQLLERMRALVSVRRGQDGDKGQ